MSLFPPAPENIPAKSPAPRAVRPALRGLTQAEIASVVAAAGFPAFRGKQVHHWVHRQCVDSFDEMKNIPKELRAWLAEHARLGGIAEVTRALPAADDSVKFLFALRDGLKVEAVLMPGSGNDPKKMTLCVSSQVGCAVDCKFCVTGANGFFRHMSADEIVGQALFARRHLATMESRGRALRNIVFMGMGEPLLNEDAVIQAIRVMTENEGMDLSPKRITVSTSGILPGLEKLASCGIPVSLAISLNGVTQAEREAIMPITRRYPLDQLLAACRRFPLKPGARITFEYVLLKDVNDTPAHARTIVGMLHGIPAKVNVIPFNPDPALPFERPEDERVLAFASIISDAFVQCNIRWSKALDVSGACGQLAGQYRQKTADGRRVVTPR